MFQYTHYVLPLLISAIVSITLVLYGWLQRKHRVSIYFSLLMIAVTIWIVMAILEIMTVSLEYRLFWANLDFIGITYIPPLLLLMIAEYLGRTKKLKRVLQASFIISTLTNIVIWTNDWHSLWYGSPSLDTTTAPFIITRYDYGHWFFWIHAPYGWIIMGAVFVMLLRDMFLANSIYRDQMLFLLSAILLPAIIDTLYIIGISPIAFFNFTPIAFSLSGIIIAWALYRYKFLDLVPVAHDIIFQNMRDMIFVIDQEYRIVDINPSAESIINGKSVRQLIGMPIMEVFPRQANLIDVHIKVDKDEAEIFLEDGTDKQYFSMNISSLKQANRVIGYLIVLRDISAQKALIEREKQLALEQQSANLQYQLITHVTHDLITPITIMKSSLYIARKTDDAEKRQQRLTTTEKHLRRLQTMLEDMMLMSKIDMLSNLSFAKINLQQLAQNLFVPYYKVAEEKDQTLNLQLCDSSIIVLVDSEYFAMAISRLLDNALQYTPENGQIQVIISCDTKHLIIEVQDNGIGIPQDELSMIFDRFYRAASHRPTDAGSGLGLSIAKRIFELHQGIMLVESVVGEGSTFRVSLPVIVTESNANHIMD